VREIKPKLKFFGGDEWWDVGVVGWWVVKTEAKRQGSGRKKSCFLSRSAGNQSAESVSQTYWIV